MGMFDSDKSFASGVNDFGVKVGNLNSRLDPADVWGQKAKQDQARMDANMAAQKAAIQQGMADKPAYQSARDANGNMLPQYAYDGRTADMAKGNVKKVGKTEKAQMSKAGVTQAQNQSGTLSKTSAVNANTAKAKSKQAAVNRASTSTGTANEATTQNAATSSLDFGQLDQRLGGAKDIAAQNVGYMGDVNAGRGAALADQDVQSLRGEAFGQGPSAWGQAMQQQQDLTRSSALDQLGRDNRNSSAQAMQDLAMQGGLEGGARERIAKASARDAVMGGQNISRQDASARLGITADDEARKASMRQAMPGMNLQLDQYNTGLAQQNRQTQNQLGMFNAQTDLGAQQTNQNLAMNKAQTWAGLQESQAARETATNQFNAANQNQGSQFNAGQQNAMSQFNAAAQNQGSQFNAAAANQVGMFNTGQSNETERANTAAQNQMNLFNAGSQNQANQFNAGAANQMSQFNTGQANATSQFNAGAANQVGMYNSGQQNAMNQFNAGSANQMNQWNTGQNNAMEQFNAGQQNGINQFNAGVYNQKGMFNAGNAIMDNRMGNAFNMDTWGQGMQALGAQGTAQSMGNQQAKGGFLSSIFS